MQATFLKAFDPRAQSGRPLISTQIKSSSTLNEGETYLNEEERHFMLSFDWKATQADAVGN